MSPEFGRVGNKIKTQGLLLVPSIQMIDIGMLWRVAIELRLFKNDAPQNLSDNRLGTPLNYHWILVIQMFPLSKQFLHSCKYT